MTTGVDLVREMIRVANDERLTLRQDDIRFDGWAVEARIYAEDARRGFLPSIGRLIDYREPAGEGIRVDSGAYEGGEVSMFYDPMIAKLIAWGPDRETATGRLLDALDRYEIRGVTTNLDFLGTILSHPRFVSGDISTDFLDREYEGGYSDPELSDEERRLFAALSSYIRLQEDLRATHVHATDVDSPWKLLKRTTGRA